MPKDELKRCSWIFIKIMRSLTSELEMIVNEKSKVRQLRVVIRAFRELRDSSEPWPETSESTDGLMGQE
jgi:hypothetical protein